jgi:PBP1b-binding outer membrane lipoprotein LpoB
MKKVFSLLTVLLLCTMLFAGCTEPASTDTDVGSDTENTTETTEKTTDITEGDSEVEYLPTEEAEELMLTNIWTEDNTGIEITFYEDGTYTMIDSYTNEEGVYTIDGDQLTIEPTNVEGAVAMTYTFTINSESQQLTYSNDYNSYTYTLKE